MADQKISQLTDGTSFQAGDEAVVNRSGTNFKVDPTVGVVQQADIGTDPNQVPLNQYLGSMAYQDLDAVSITGGTVVVDGLTVDTDTLYVDATNNRVGVGTSSPRSLLNVVSSSSAGGVLTLENSSGSLITDRALGQIDFYSNDASANGTGVKAKIQAIALNSIGNEVGITFGTSGTGSATAVEAMRIDSSGNLLVGTTTSPSDTGTVVADGIYLGGTAAANLLDDYEEGTFTPTIGATTTDPTITYSGQQGFYTKIGDRVYFRISINISSFSGGAGNIVIQGLPFTSAASQYPQFFVSTEGVSFPSGRTLPIAYIQPSNTIMYMQGRGDNVVGSFFNVSNFSASDSINIVGHYQV